MKNFPHVRGLAGRRAIRRLAIAFSMLLALSTVVTSAGAAQASASHAAVFHVGAMRDTPDVAYCNPAGHVFCVYENSSCTQNMETIPTVDHSKWFTFSGIESLYNPECLVNDTNSSVWVLDKQINSAICAPPNSYVQIFDGQWGYFYVKYNVSSCGSEPGGE